MRYHVRVVEVAEANLSSHQTKALNNLDGLSIHSRATY